MKVSLSEVGRGGGEADGKKKGEGSGVERGKKWREWGSEGWREDRERQGQKKTDRQTEWRVDIVRAVTLRKASTVLDLPKVMMVSSAWMCSRAWAAMFSTLKMPTFSRHVNITSWPQQRLLALLLATSHC